MNSLSILEVHIAENLLNIKSFFNRGKLIVQYCTASKNDVHRISLALNSGLKRINHENT